MIFEEKHEDNSNTDYTLCTFMSPLTDGGGGGDGGGVGRWGSRGEVIFGLSKMTLELFTLLGGGSLF